MLTTLDRQCLAILVDWQERPTHAIAYALGVRIAPARGSMRRLHRLGYVSRRTNPDNPIEYLFRAIPDKCRDLLEVAS